MSTLNPTRKISRRHELREDKVVTMYARVLELTENNRPLLYAAAAGIVMVVAAVVAFSMWRAQQNQTALDRMSAAVQLYEAGNFRVALDGTPDALGLLDIADSYGGTAAGNLARFYSADALFQLGEYDEALPLFRAYSKDDNYVGASALAGEAAILEDRGEFEQAGDLYRKAALAHQSEVLSPSYLMKAGRAYESAGRRDDAAEAYARIRDDFKDSSEATNIDFYLARVASDTR